MSFDRNMSLTVVSMTWHLYCHVIFHLFWTTQVITHCDRCRRKVMTVWSRTTAVAEAIAQSLKRSLGYIWRSTLANNFPCERWPQWPFWVTAVVLPGDSLPRVDPRPCTDGSGSHVPLYYERHDNNELTGCATIFYFLLTNSNQDS